MHIFLPLLILLSVAKAGFIPGGSFGRPTIGPYNNCSRTLTTRPKNFAIDTLPNISSDDPTGWERWDLTMYQSSLALFMTWIQGDPASYNSVPGNGTFELVAKFSNGTSYRTRTSDHKLTFTNQSGYSISIAGNTLSWDDSQAWFNATLDLNGLTATLESQSIMLDKFSPNAGSIIGQLSEGLFVGTPLTRGNSRGSIIFPWGASVLMDAESVLNHMFSVEPLQKLVTNYAIRTFRSYGTRFGDTFIHESSRALNTSQYEAFFLGRAKWQCSLEPYTIYAGTNSELLSVNQINTTIHAQLAGCNHTNSVPFSWSYTLPDTGHTAPVAQHIDSAGGTTNFYLVNATASEPDEGAVSHQRGTGLLQVYEALGAPTLQDTQDLGGE